MLRICKNCKKEDEYLGNPKSGFANFCSIKCMKEYKEKDNKSQLRKCLYCNKEYWWESNQSYYVNDNGYKINSKKYCCFDCGIKAHTDKVKQGMLNKYGVENISLLKENKLKVSNSWKNKTKEQIKDITNKAKNTKLNRYGKENYVNVKAAKNTKLEKYGNENYNNIDKIKQTNLEKYGVEIVSCNESIKNKISLSYSNKTQQELFEIQNKRKETCINRYGVENIIDSNEIKEKIKETCNAKYGVDHPLKSDYAKKQREKTILQKYGVKYIGEVKEIQDKIKNTNKNKHGYEYPFQDTELRNMMEINRINTNISKYGTPHIIQVEEFKEKAKQTCLDKYGVEYNCLTDNCINANGKIISKTNLYLSDKLTQLGIKNELEFKLKKYSFDIKVNNTLIEINPTYTHNSTLDTIINKHKIPKKDIDYHFNKTLYAKDNNYRCIHVWDWDQIEKIVYLLSNKEKIYARNCEIKEVDLDITNEFLNLYHLQNSCRNQEIRLGLYYNEELIEIMTFGKPRYNNKYQYELLRLCTKPNYIVIGGANKLFKYFINTYNPESIISYCDNSKFNGNVYIKLGMQLKTYGKPCKHWYNITTHKHFTDNLVRQRGFSQLHNDKVHIKGESNDKLMIQAGYVEIWDCGQSTYVWHN